MSQSTRSDQSQQGQPEPGSEAALQQAMSSLRAQNDQLWKIIEKQRLIIQNLQKDLHKVSADRDLLRQLATDHGLLQPNGHHRPQAQPGQHPDKENVKQASTHSLSSSSQQASDQTLEGSSSPEADQHQQQQQHSHHHHHHQQQQQQQQQHPHQQQNQQHQHQQQHYNQPKHSFDQVHTNKPSPEDFEQDAIQEQVQSLAVLPVEDDNDLDGHDVQLATATRLQHPALHHDRNGHSQHPPAQVGSPTSSRNVSANLALGPLASLMPHLPPRSPRRGRDMESSSPAQSDNEDESGPHSPQASRRKANMSAPIITARQASAREYGQDMGSDQDIMAAGKVSMKQANAYESHSEHPSSQATSPSTRRTISAQIPIIPQSMMTPPQTQGQPQHELAPPSADPSLPASPIAAIIDQDAEKFRVYMNKLTNPSRKMVSAPIQTPGEGQIQDHASALGQAVAMENIQNQIEIQSQLMGQVQGHGGRGLNPVQKNGRPGQQHQEDDNRDDTQERDHSRSKRRESTLQMPEDYPKIAARSTSHNRGEDDDVRDLLMGPPAPKRFDSQPQLEQAHMRVASPTPSGNSSLTNALSSQPPLGHSRSAPTLHQQAFSMFPENLEFVSVLVVGSNITTNDKGKEQLTFLVSIGQEVQGEREDILMPHREGDELWRVEKQYMDFVNLDAKLRVTQSRNIVNSLPRLPDKSLFSTHAPSKVDARKVALEQYLQQVTSLRIKDTRDLCEFLSTHVVERERRKEGVEAGYKEGYLTKRGKNFGGWKTRFFVLRGPVLEYFDTKDGHHLGSIALTSAQIGRQQSQEKPQDQSNDKEGGAVDPNSYRHAFLILEPKKGQTVVDAKKNPSNVVRHVLCAETDEERDDWVDALMLYVGKEPVEEEREKSSGSSGRRLPEIQKLGATPIKDLASVKGNEKLLLNQEAYERQQRSIPPLSSTSSQGRGNGPMSPTGMSMNMDDRHSAERQSAEGQYTRGNGSFHGETSYQPPQSLPRNHSTPSLTQDDTNYSKSMPESQSPETVAERKQKSRMTFWPKKAKDEAPAQMPGSMNQQQQQQQQQGGAGGMSSSQGQSQDSSRLRNFLGKGSSNSVNSNTTHGPGGSAGTQSHHGQNPNNNRGNYSSLAPIRQVFGVTLEQAIEQAQIQPGYELPAVVFRCIEYLNAHKAKLEEGIYRLNGSSAVIKSLKERFNHDGDVPLLASDEYYDIHAVAGLLKLFLRDLPASVLTRELHKDFLQVIELPTRNDRVDELTRLVASLPEANYTLLRALTAHLIEIVENADINKMTARNVGIVFSPTLGIPAGVFSLLMSDFDIIFHTHDGRIMPLENSDGPSMAQQQQQQQQQQQHGQHHYHNGVNGSMDSGMDSNAVQA